MKQHSWLSYAYHSFIQAQHHIVKYLIGYMIILAIFTYSAAVRAFSLTNELFERGLRWINGGQEVTGDSNAEQQNRMIIAQVGGRAEGAASASRHLNAGKRPHDKPPTPTQT